MNAPYTRKGRSTDIRVSPRFTSNIETVPWPSEPTPEVVQPEAPEAEVTPPETAPGAELAPPSEDWPQESLADSWDPSELPTDPTSERLRRKAAALRAGKPAESAESREYISPVDLCQQAAAGDLRCDRCGSDELERFPARDGTWWRWDCMACGFGEGKHRTGHTVAFTEREADA